MTHADSREHGQHFFGRWLVPRVGSGELGEPVRHAGGCGWSVQFGSSEKYLWAADEVLSDPYLLCLATMRLERSGWVDEPGTEELRVDADWARGARHQLEWVNPAEGVAYGVTFWSSSLGAKDRATFVPLPVAAESEDDESQPDDPPAVPRECHVAAGDLPLSPPKSDPVLNEKLLRILGM